MSAGLHVECDRCHRELTAPGGLLFGPPTLRKRRVAVSAKRHLCGECYRDVVGFILRGPGPEYPRADPGDTEP